MAMEIKQVHKLSQQLVMTPQLQQAIKLLQLSRMELVDLVREEMMENPVLEDDIENQNELSRDDQIAEPSISRAGRPEVLERRRCSACDTRALTHASRSA